MIIENKKICKFFELPENIQELLTKKHQITSNNSFIEFSLYDVWKHESLYKNGKLILVELDYLVEEGDDIISDYFMESGCDIDDEILILIKW